MDALGGRDEVTLADYVRPLWRFKFGVILLVALAAAGTYLYTKRETKVYQTSTLVYVGQSQLQQLISPAATQSSTVAADASFVTSPAVASAVRRQLNLPYSPDALLGAVTAVPSATSPLLTITATNSNPALAARLANGFASAFLQLRQTELVSSARTALKAIERQLGRTPIQSPARSALLADISTYSSAIASPPSVGSVVNPAVVPGAPISPKPVRDAIFAAAMALLLGIILSYLFDRRDRKVRSLAEIDALFAAPVLATIPHVRRAEPKRRDVGSIPPKLLEANRMLRVSLELARTVHPGSVILVTSALPGEGKTTIVRNLAMAYRDAGQRVAVVEADLRRPALAAQLGLDEAPGLSEALEKDDMPRIQRLDAGSNGGGGRLDVVVAGRIPHDPTRLLDPDRLRGVLRRLAAAYDVVLVDSPPALVVSDALPLMCAANGTLLVVRAGRITRPAAARLRRTIDRTNRSNRVDVLGVVANDVVDELTSSYGGYMSSAAEASGEPVTSSTERTTA